MSSVSWHFSSLGGSPMLPCGFCHLYAICNCMQFVIEVIFREYSICLSQMIIRSLKTCCSLRLISKYKVS